VGSGECLQVRGHIVDLGIDGRIVYKMDIRNAGYKDADVIHLKLHKIKIRAFFFRYGKEVSMLLRGGDLLTSCKAVSF
jgi:hypothetical protein